MKGIVSAHVFDCKRVLFLSSFPQDILSAQLGRVVIDLTAIPVSVRGTGGESGVWAGHPFSSEWRSLEGGGRRTLGSSYCRSHPLVVLSPSPRPQPIMIMVGGDPAHDAPKGVAEVSSGQNEEHSLGQPAWKGFMDKTSGDGIQSNSCGRSSGQKREFPHGRFEWEGCTEKYSPDRLDDSHGESRGWTMRRTKEPRYNKYGTEIAPQSSWGSRLRRFDRRAGKHAAWLEKKATEAQEENDANEKQYQQLVEQTAEVEREISSMTKSTWPEQD